MTARDPSWLRRCLQCGGPFGDVLLPRGGGALHGRCVRRWLGLEVPRGGPGGICDGCGLPGAPLDPALGAFVHAGCGTAQDERQELLAAPGLSVPAWHRCLGCRRRAETGCGEVLEPCACGRRGFKAWETRLDGPWPDPPPGYVRVVSSEGWQELRGPAWREDPSAWRRDPMPREHGSGDGWPDEKVAETGGLLMRRE